MKNKLNNKAYVKNAPKEIVNNDKKLIKELIVEDEKLRSIVSVLIKYNKIDKKKLPSRHTSLGLIEPHIVHSTTLWVKPKRM